MTNGRHASSCRTTGPASRLTDRAMGSICKPGLAPAGMILKLDAERVQTLECQSVVALRTMPHFHFAARFDEMVTTEITKAPEQFTPALVFNHHSHWSQLNEEICHCCRLVDCITSA